MAFQDSGASGAKAIAASAALRAAGTSPSYQAIAGVELVRSPSGRARGHRSRKRRAGLAEGGDGIVGAEGTARREVEVGRREAEKRLRLLRGERGLGPGHGFRDDPVVDEFGGRAFERAGPRGGVEGG
jgi:hypothetical protein